MTRLGLSEIEITSNSRSQLCRCKPDFASYALNTVTEVQSVQIVIHLRQFHCYYRFPVHILCNVFHFNKMLSCRRKTALQGAFVWAKSENWNWETIFYGQYMSIFNHCDIIVLQMMMMMIIVDLYSALRRAPLLRYVSRCIVKRNVFSADR